MSAGRLVSAYAYEVEPRQGSAFAGGSIPISLPLQRALDRTFERSKIGHGPSVSFIVDASSPTRAHPIRDAALAISFTDSDQEQIVEALARRLADSMDNRSKPSLLMVTVHESGRADVRRLLIWTFPQQEVFNLVVRAGRSKLELMDAFNRESSLRKAAMIEGPNEKTGMLSARVLDLQSTMVDRSVADFWIFKFLHARVQMSSLEGTQLLSRALRNAHRRAADDPVAQAEISAAITSLRIPSQRRRWSIDTIASTFLSGQTATTFLEGARDGERAALFEVDLEQFDRLIHFMRFTLTNGVVVSAPFVQIGVDGAVSIEEIEGKRVLQVHGEIKGEQVRTRG